MSHQIMSGELLRLADLLAEVDGVRAGTGTAHLRRAVSSAYYALFHELVSRAALQAVGPSPERQPDRHALARAYSHSVIRTVSQWVLDSAQDRKPPDLAAALLRDPPAELVAVAQVFCKSQDRRETADYDHAVTITPAQTRDHIAAVRRVPELLGQLEGDRAYRNYLTLLLGGPRLAARR